MSESPKVNFCREYDPALPFIPHPFFFSTNPDLESKRL